jgi:hypothetical protein
VEGGGYFPVTVRLKTGEILSILRGGARHIGVKGRLDPVTLRSQDKGKTWSRPERSEAIFRFYNGQGHVSPCGKLVQLPHGSRSGMAAFCSLMASATGLMACAPCSARMGDEPGSGRSCSTQRKGKGRHLGDSQVVRLPIPAPGLQQFGL